MFETYFDVHFSFGCMLAILNVFNHSDVHAAFVSHSDVHSAFHFDVCSAFGCM